MRKTALLLCAAFLLLAETAVAEVNFRDFRMARWGGRAETCGKIYQNYVVYEMEHLLTNLREDMWRRARELGAREDEIAVLEERFEIGRKKAMELSFNQNISEIFHENRVMGLKGDLDWNYKYCTNTLE